MLSTALQDAARAVILLLLDRPDDNAIRGSVLCHDAHTRALLFAEHRAAEQCGAATLPAVAP